MSSSLPNCDSFVNQVSFQRTGGAEVFHGIFGPLHKHPLLLIPLRLMTFLGRSEWWIKCSPGWSILLFLSASQFWTCGYFFSICLDLHCFWVILWFYFILFYFEKPLTQTSSLNDLVGNPGIQREEISYSQPVRLLEQHVGRRRLQTLPRQLCQRADHHELCPHRGWIWQTTIKEQQGLSL